VDDTTDISDTRAYNNESPWAPSPGARGSLLTSATTLFTQPLWLLACAERQKFTTKLVNLDVDAQNIRSDMELATLVKEQYTKRRPGWQQVFRLRGFKHDPICTGENYSVTSVSRSPKIDIRVV
jgi:hypothetical protein